MKLNISYPANGSQKIVEVDDERKLRPFMEKRMGTEVSLFPLPLLYYARGLHENCVNEGMCSWLMVGYRLRVTPSVMNSRATFSRSPVVTTSKVRWIDCFGLKAMRRASG